MLSVAPQGPVTLHAQNVTNRHDAQGCRATISSQSLDKAAAFKHSGIMDDWIPDLSRSDKPRYLAIADLIAEDIGAGALEP